MTKATSSIYLALAILFLVFLSSSLCMAQEDLLELYEVDAEEYRQKGFEAQQKGFLAEALQYYSEALTLAPTRPDIYNDIGIIFERMGDLYEAKRHYLMALRVDPSYLPAYSNLAYFYKKQGDILKAIEFFKRRMELGGPKDPWTEEAAGQLRAMSTSSPELKKWLMGYEASLLDKEVTKVNNELEDAELKRIVQNNIDAQLHLEQARTYRREELYGKALAEYDKAIALESSDQDLREEREEILFKFKEKEIKERMEQALLKLESGDVRSSKEEIRKILFIIPDN